MVNANSCGATTDTKPIAAYLALAYSSSISPKQSVALVPCPEVQRGALCQTCIVARLFYEMTGKTGTCGNECDNGR